MLYPKNVQSFDTQLFENPTAEYRGTPFWAWNCELKSEELLWQIEQLKSMGFGGFHMHVRTGMATPYLSDEYMQLIRDCVEKARQESMLAWLYDEDRWPSGAAGGLVTKDPAYRARHLLFTAQSYAENQSSAENIISAAKGARTGNGRLIASYDVRLDAEGNLAGYRLNNGTEPAEAGVRRWYAYVETANASPWFNNQTYVDTLNKKAIDAFIRTTHDRYAATVGADFGGVVPAIFTDEPQFSHKTTLNFAAEQTDVILPWTDDLPETYQASYGEDLLAHLPELFWELPGAQVSRTRYLYHDHIAERFAEAFADNCGAWCRQHNLMLTGHMMEEPTLASQTAALGEAMRSYRGFDLPGIDMLCDRYELTTAKQAQSAARQFGCPGVLSELYGVTNWDFDFRGHKLQGDWQAALGVTVRVPHLSWVSMAGEAKRDYPATINYQVPWFKEYPVVEDHFARVNTALTRGQAVCRVGVIHPVESYWLIWGSQEKTAAARAQMDANFQALTQWLLLGQIDFDFISESLLPGQCPAASAPLAVGQMKYDVVIVPDLRMLRSTTASRLEAFSAAGGRLIFLCDRPELIDGRPDDRLQALYDRSEKLPLAQVAVLQALEPVREVSLLRRNGSRADDLLYQLRQDGANRWLFIARGRHPENKDIPRANALKIKLRGHWRLTLMNTMDGSRQVVPADRQTGWTSFDRTLYDHDSLLLLMEPAAPVNTAAAAYQPVRPAALPSTCLERNWLLPAGQVPVRLSEPNALLLDIAEYALDSQPWQPAEEILRADNQLRQLLNYPSRREAFAQPWTVPAEKSEHQARLRFTIAAEIPVTAPSLALEDAAAATIILNGQLVPSVLTGWYVDKAIQTVRLPDLPAGRSVLEVVWPFGRRTNLEWCYLLGDFGVRVAGAAKVLTAPVRQLAFGDIVPQGLPFYGGNVIYQLQAESRGGSLTIHAPYYRGALIAVAVDGNRAGRIIYSPYDLTVNGLADGAHQIDLILYGNRVNSFGPVHNCVSTISWVGPNAWRSTDNEWSYEYQLHPTGILKAPWVG